MKDKKGFTILEVIFVIVIIGILTAIALPKFKETKIEAEKAKVSQILEEVKASIQSKVGDQVLLGSYKCPNLEKSTTDSTVFENILNGGVPAEDGGITWSIIAGGPDDNYTTYKVNIDGETTEIEYNKTDKCQLECPLNDNLCLQLLK